MPNAKVLSEKQAIVEALAQRIQNASAGILVDYRGITVAEDTALRTELRKDGVEYTVVKNTLMIAVFFRSSPAELAGADFARFMELTSLKALLAARIPQFFIMLAVQALVIAALQASPALLRLIREKTGEPRDKGVS